MPDMILVDGEYVREKKKWFYAWVPIRVARPLAEDVRNSSFLCQKITKAAEVVDNS